MTDVSDSGDSGSHMAFPLTLSHAVTRVRNACARLAAVLATAPQQEAVIRHSSLPFSSMRRADWQRAVSLWNDHAAQVLADVPPRPCPACGGTASRYLFESYDAHRFDECATCGCWYTPKLVEWSVFERFFASCDDAAVLARAMMQGRDSLAGRDADMARIGAYLDELVPLLPVRSASPLYLDTGCGVGHSLRAGLERGLQVHGVEVDPEARALATAAGFSVTNADEPVPGGPYDLLSFWETLEHIADPLAALQRFLPVLSEDGLVAITIPNLNAMEVRLLRDACPWVHGGYNTPGHLQLLHRGAIETLLSRAGLTMLDAQGQYSANPLTLLLAIGGRTRGAYDMLDDMRPEVSLPEGAEDVVNGIWPGLALLESYMLATPILRVTACRQGREHRFAPAIARWRASRARQVNEAAGTLLAHEPDYQAIVHELGGGVELRDRQLVERVEALNQLRGEAESLQRTASALQQELVGLQGQLGRAQEEINIRDALLDASRRRFARTLEGRLVAGGQFVLRAFRQGKNR